MPTKLEIKNKYQHLSVSQWGLYLPINFAFDFLYECDANDLLVIGIECFIHHGNGVVEAQTDLIADHSDIYDWKDSWVKRRAASNRKAFTFLRELPDRLNLVAEFVVLDQ